MTSEANASAFTRNIQYVNLMDRTDRLGTNLVWYISTILLAIKNNYKICLIKPKTQYSYYNSIFVESLINFIEEYNERHFPNTSSEDKKKFINQDDEYFKKIIRCLINIKCDFITGFREQIFTQNFKDNLNELAKIRGYNIPYDSKKSIVVHLRLDDRQNYFVSDKDRENYSNNFRNIINNDDVNFKFPGFGGQSAICENKIKEIIERVSIIYKDYEVIIITNGEHNLPYKTIRNDDESYDLFLLCNSEILIGSMSTFSFCSVMFGNHQYVYYPLWDHFVLFGITTKYDKTNNDKSKIIECF